MKMKIEVKEERNESSDEDPSFVRSSNKMECLMCNRLMCTDFRSLKVHCVSIHMPGVSAIRCRHCTYSEPWYPGNMGFHTLVFHGEDETEYNDDREELLPKLLDVIRQCFPGYRIPLDLSNPTAKKNPQIKGPLERLRPKCRFCDIKTRNMSYEKRVFHSIVKHQDKPGLICKICKFETNRSVKQMKDHVLEEHRSLIGTSVSNTALGDHYVDQRKDANLEIYQLCYSRDQDLSMSLKAALANRKW